MARRRSRHFVRSDRPLSHVVDSAFAVIGKSAHTVLTSVGVEPDVTLLTICVHVYVQLCRWGLLPDPMCDDDLITAALIGDNALTTAPASGHVTTVYPLVPGLHMSVTPAESRSGSSAADDRSQVSSSIELVEEEEEMENGMFSSAFTDFSSPSLEENGPVVFRGIRESYAADADIIARFVYENFDPQPGDVVVIKQTAWKPDQVLTSLVSVSVSEATVETKAQTENIMRVKFAPSLFSGIRTGDEFFQFCYISDARVQGASRTFSIIRPKEQDYADSCRDEDVNDDDGFVVLKSPQARFQDNMEQLQTDVIRLQARNGDLKRQLLVVRKEQSTLAEEKDAQLAMQRNENSVLMREIEELKAEKERIVEMHRSDKSELSSALEKQEQCNLTMQQAFQETSDELTRVRTRHAELSKDVNDLLRRRLEQEELCEASERKAMQLKEELKQLQYEKSLASAERDMAIANAETLQSALNQESAARKKEQEENESKVAQLKRNVEDLKNRLETAAQLYQEQSKQCNKLENKLQRLHEKLNVRSFPLFDPVVLTWISA